MRNTPSNFEMKRIAESFFKEKGTFSVDNVMGLMSKAFQIGYDKGHLDGKHEISASNIKTYSASDLKKPSTSWDFSQWDSLVRKENKLPGLTTEQLPALNLKDLKFPEPCNEWKYPFYT